MGNLHQYIEGAILEVTLTRSGNEPIERARVTWKMPDGTVVEFASDDSDPAVVVDSATALTVTIPAAYSDQRGEYELQAWLEVLGGRVIPTEVKKVPLFRSNVAA